MSNYSALDLMNIIRELKFSMKSNFDKIKFGIVEDSTIDTPNNYCVVDVTRSVAAWIEQQPIHLWKPVDGPTLLTDRYIISNDLFTVMALKWS